MPSNLRGRWDKLYSEVRVCVFCAQLFEPTVKTLEQQLEDERKAEEILHNKRRDTHRHEQPQTDDIAEKRLSSHQKRPATSESAAEIQRQRSFKLASRNSAVFRRRCGFGSSNVQRPTNFWGEVVSDNDGFGDRRRKPIGAAGAVRNRDRGNDDNDADEHAVLAKKKQVRIPHAKMDASNVPQPSNPTFRRRPGTANARSVGRSYRQLTGGTGQGSGLATSGTRPVRPKSAAPGSRSRKSAGFGSSSSRIITYRGHNRQDPKVHTFRDLRIDPIQQAKAMLAAKQYKNGKGDGGLRAGTAASRRRFAGGERPASASVGRRRRGEKEGAARRPQTASVWPYRRNRVPRPEWRSIL